MSDPANMKMPAGLDQGCPGDGDVFPKEDIHGSIPRRFEKVVRRFPRHTAISYEGREMAYQDLNRLANRTARVVRSALEDGSGLVAILMDLGPDQIGAMLGVQKAGAFHVVLDPSFPEARTAEIIEVYGPLVLIADRINADLARTVFPQVGNLLVFEELPIDLGEDNLDLAIKPDDFAAVFYTADPAGRPRGVLYDHRSLLHGFWDVTTVEGDNPADRIAQWQSMAFFGAVVTSFEALLSGACLCLYNMKKQGLTGLLAWITEEQVTSVAFMPSAFRRLFSEGVAPENVRSVRLLRLRGEAVEQCDLELYRKIFPDHGVMGLSLGLTEVCRVAYSHLTKESMVTEKVLPMSCLARDKEITLRDEDGREAPRGEPGEIVVASRYNFRGYWPLDEPAEASEPGLPESRIYHTGDWGRFLPDGSLQYVGRKDDLVKIRGHRLQLGEVEAALSAIRQVKEAAVVGRDDADGVKYLHAYFVPREQGAVYVETLRAQLKAKLPGYAIPARFTMVAALPRNALGRVDRTRLPDTAGGRPEMLTAYVPPETNLESRLVDIWQGILKVEPIGRNDNFFDLGGDSLNAVELALEMERLSGGSFSVSDFLAWPTISQLVELLDQPNPEQNRTAILPVKPGGSRPAFYVVSPEVDNALIFRFLGSYMDSDQPLFALRRKQVIGSGNLPESIEGIVENDLPDLLRHQPRGPYYLGGYSFGTYLAFELAQKLIKQGHEVGMLAFFDCPPRPGWRGVLATLKERASYVVHVLKNGEGKPHQRFYGNFSTWLRNRFLNTSTMVLGAYWRKTGQAQKRLDLARLPLVAGKKAMAKYRPSPYPGTITFFQTEIFKYVPEKQWRKVAAGIKVHHVQGTHHTLLHEPHVAGLAELFNRELDQAREEAERLKQEKP